MNNKLHLWIFVALTVFVLALGAAAIDQTLNGSNSKAESENDTNFTDVNMTENGADSNETGSSEFPLLSEINSSEIENTNENQTSQNETVENNSETENDSQEIETNESISESGSNSRSSNGGGASRGTSISAVVQSFSAGFSEEIPTAGQTFVPLKSNLSVKVNSTQAEFDMKISLFEDGELVASKDYNDVQSGTFSFNGDNYVTKKGTTYTWEVEVAGANPAKQSYTFTTGMFSDTKWKTNIGNSSGSQIHPVMGDIDSDGVQEIVMAVGERVIAVNGETGAIEWSVTGSAKTAVELVDLDVDGEPEVLFGTSSKRVRALNGDGKDMWQSAILNGSIQAEFPIVAADVDADGYPEIFYASGDVTPSPYSGNDSEYTGALTKLDHNGKVLATTWIHHPCWGGLALGDYDFDGKFEIYMGDRRAGFQGFPAKGLQAFDADTLATLWSRPELQHSSPMAILDDVYGDTKMEVVAEPITIKGPIIMHPNNGSTITDYSNLRLPTHATGTTYDIDGDGNLEIFLATAYPETAPKNIVVFDLVDGKVDFTDNFSFHATWPPTAADVTGDGKLDIISSMGDQDNYTENFPLIIYNDKFVKVEEKVLEGAGQLMPALVGDADGDGKNEIVVAGITGLLFLIETDADVADNQPRTWVQRYSEYRRGAAEFVELPGPKAPLIRDAIPADGSTNLSSNVVLSADLFDYQKDDMDVAFELNDGSGWKTLKEFENEENGRLSADASAFISSNKRYEWKITAEDDEGNSNSKTVVFDTGFVQTNTTTNTTNTTNSTNTTNTTNQTNTTGWKFNVKMTVDHTKVAGDLSDFPLLVDVTNSGFVGELQDDAGDLYFTSQDNTKLAHEIESYDPASGRLVVWIRIPQLSSDVDTVLYMHYGNMNAENQAQVEDVWDSNYLAVHHLEETEGKVFDSTRNNNDGIQQSMTPQQLKINGGDVFDGVDDRIVLPRVYNAEKEFTIEGWMRFSGTRQGYMVSQRNLSLKGAFVQYYPKENNFQFFVNSNKTTVEASANEWHYVVATYKNGEAKLYVDAKAPSSVAVPVVTWPDENTYIGDRVAGSRALNGTLDEIRMSNVARSYEYILTSYENQNSPSLFVDIEGMEYQDIVCTDADSDGFSVEGGACGLVDCNDAENDVNPSEDEIDCDGIDNDCSGSDSCSSTPDEVCDDFADNDGDGEADCADSDCSDFASCTNSCGNGNVETDEFRSEECDDANSANGDGCSATCYVEEGYECSGEPSICTESEEPQSCNGADLNDDAKVNLEDLMLVIAELDRADCAAENGYCNGADMNKDGKVNRSDLLLFVPNFGLDNCEA